MGINPQAGVLKSKGKVGKPRRFGRLPQECLACNLGTVLDISAGGMCVLGRKVPTHRFEIELWDEDLPGPLHGVVVWSKRVSFFKNVIGVQFVDVAPEVAKRVTEMAGIYRKRRVI